MDHIRSLWFTWCAWFAYACCAPILIISWYVLLTFNPHDSYWLYDSSLHSYSLIHPVNLVGLLVYGFGSGAFVIMSALTHGIFRLSKQEQSSLQFIDYGAGYLFLLMALSGMSAFFGYDSLNATACGGLLGQEIHALMLSCSTEAIELLALQLVMVWGSCMTLGFSWVRPILILFKPVAYPLMFVMSACLKCKNYIQQKTSMLTAPLKKAWCGGKHSADHELENDVYEITRGTVTSDTLTRDTTSPDTGSRDTLLHHELQ